MTFHKDEPARDAASEFPWTVLSWLGAYLIVAIGAVHFLQSDELVKDGATPYALAFILNFALCCVAAFFLARIGSETRWPWMLGAAVCSVSLVAFFVSRIFGLPGLPSLEESWFTLPGLMAVTLELAFLGVAGLFLTRPGRAVVAVEQRLMENEPTPRRVAEIEDEMARMREQATPTVREAAGRANAGGLFSSASRAASLRLSRTLSENQEELKKLGVGGVALLTLAYILNRSRR